MNSKERIRGKQGVIEKPKMLLYDKRLRRFELTGIVLQQQHLRIHYPWFWFHSRHRVVEYEGTRNQQQTEEAT